jgi:hypothetical protein
MADSSTLSMEKQPESTRTSGHTAAKFSSSAFSDSTSEVYRSMSRSALGSFTLGLLGLSSFTVVHLIILPLVGLVLGFLGLRSIKRYPEEFSGWRLAMAGLALSGATLLSAPAYHAYIYLTEVPEGYERVRFSDLMSSKGQPDIPTAAAIELHGQQVFVKGYVHPSSMDTAMSKKFVIVPDLGTCCFGGQPPLTHMIEVTLSGDKYAHRNFRKKSLAGTFLVNPHLKPIEGLTGVYYQLQADVLK